MNPNDPTQPRMVLATERQLEALKLRIEGKLYREIAAELGINESAVCKLIQRGLKQTRDEIAGEANTLRALQSERLDKLIAKVWPLVDCDKPDLTAVLRLSQLLKRRASLLGLDIPREDTLNIPQLDAVKTVLLAPDNGRLREPEPEKEAKPAKEPHKEEKGE